MARKLRIAVSVFFGLLTVALCALWVRSYGQLDVVGFAGRSQSLEMISRNGGLILNYGPLDGHSPQSWWHWHDNTHTSLRLSGFGFDYVRDMTNTYIEVPHMYSIAVTMCGSVIPVALAYRNVWWPCRFSLRTLLLATTLLAVVLGLMVWLAS